MVNALYLPFQHGKNAKMTPRKEKGSERWVLRPREVRASHGRKRMEAPFSCAPPIPSQEARTQKGGGEADGRDREVGRGSKMAGGCGEVLLLLLTQQLAQMAAEARPFACWVRRSQPGGSSWPTVGGKGPWKEFLQAGKVKKTRKYQPGTVAL